MTQEILDIVDENNYVVGKDLRSNIHLNNYFHRSVHIFVLNSKNELFVQKRKKDADSYPGYYDSSASGHVLAGETYEEAAIRELGEELNLKNINLKKLNIFDADGTGIPIIRSGKRGKELKVLAQRKTNGKIRAAGMSIGKYKGGWDKLFKPLLDSLKSFKEIFLITDGDSSILKDIAVESP